MWYRIQFACCLLGTTALFASELAPKQAAGAYSNRCQLEDVSVGVDFLRRSLPTPRGIQIIPGILIFETGVFPKQGRKAQLTLASFELDSGKSHKTLHPVPASYAIATLKHIDWRWRTDEQPGLAIEAGPRDPRTGEPAVVIGRDRPQPRFPGDVRRYPPQNAPEATPENRAPEYEPHPDELPGRILALHALPSGVIANPAAGYVYFAYEGKLKKLRKARLTVRTGGQTCQLPIGRP